MTKNRSALLEKSLQRSQKLKKEQDELIVVDAASEDSTLKVIKKYKKIIDKFISEPDLSPSHGANKGILISSGKYIKYLTDDDTIHPEAMGKAIKILEQNPDIDILECGGVLYNTVTKKTTTFYNPPGINFGKNIDDLFKYRSNALSLIIRRSALSKIGISPIDPIGDANFLINAFNNGARIKYCRVNLYYHEVRSDNVSGGPQINTLIFRAIRKNATKKYFLRFAFNRLISEHRIFKTILAPVIFLYKFANDIDRNANDQKAKKYKWDGGFS